MARKPRAKKQTANKEEIQEQLNDDSGIAENAITEAKSKVDYSAEKANAIEFKFDHGAYKNKTLKVMDSFIKIGGAVIDAANVHFKYKPVEGKDGQAHVTVTVNSNFSSAVIGMDDAKMLSTHLNTVAPVKKEQTNVINMGVVGQSGVGAAKPCAVPGCSG